MNKGLAGSGCYLVNTFVDTILKLFPHNQGVADFLKNVQVSPEDYSEALLSGVGMIPSWRRRGKMAVFFSVVDGKFPSSSSSPVWVCFVKAKVLSLIF